MPPLHHPTYSGYWIHPSEGEFSLRPKEHHSQFFQARPELFGEDINAAFEEGWVSIRRWVGETDVWAIRYHRLAQVSGVLQLWARGVVGLHPTEAPVSILGFPGNGEPGAQGISLQAVAEGKLPIILSAWAAAPLVPEEYVWGSRLNGYFRERCTCSMRIGTNGRLGQHPDDCWISVRHFEACGGRFADLEDLLLADQAEFDMAAQLPWTPTAAYWSHGIAGGSVAIPSLKCLNDVIRYVQNTRGILLPRGGVYLHQSGIRTLEFIGDKVVEHRHRPELQVKVTRRGRSFRILGSPDL